MVLLLCAAPTYGQPPPNDSQDSSRSQQIECEDGTLIENGVEIIVRDMQGGLFYTATVLGIDNFNPVLAIVSEDEPPRCVNNTREVDNYTVDLPTTSFIGESRGNVQLRFNNGTQGETVDISVIVGEARGQQGEFVLLLEGMFIDQFDETGDVFSLHLNESIITADMPPTVYAISITGDLDPVLVFVDNNGEVLTDEAEALISCDDAGFEESCWGENTELQNFFVTRSFNRQLSARSLDTMLTVPTDLQEDEIPEFHNYMVNSYQGSTFGDYVIAFHISTRLAE